MLEMFLGLQVIITFFVSAKLLDNATNIGFFAAVVFGGIPGVVLMMGLYMILPRIMLFVGAAFWATTGYSLGSSMGAEGATMAALVLLLGGIGFAANYTLAEAGLQAQRENAAKAPQSSGWKAPAKADMAESGDDLLHLAQANARLFNRHIIAPATYGRIAATLPPHGKVDPVDADSEAGCEQLFNDLGTLSDHNFLSPDEESEAMRTLDTLTAPAEARRRAAAPPVVRTVAARPPPLTARMPQTEPDPQVTRSKLLHLVACRALPMDGFARAMLKIDPAFDPRTARIENFPQQWPVPESADIAKDLYRSGVMTLEDLQGALDMLASQQD